MPICTDFIQPLNLQCLFVNTFSGTPLIFVVISFFIISAMAAVLKMNGFIFLAFIALFSVIVAEIYPPIYVFSIIIGSLIIYYSINKITKF